jgi:D-alanyl-lipoteichoic acid acyltransferase DltB (MBOAT superfamily)
MRFNSFDFLVFFALVLAVYWRLPRRGQNLFLLGASYVFYGWVHPWFLYLLMGSTLMDWAAGLGMARFPARKRLLLVVSLIGNLGLLCTFKYFDFFVANLAALLARFGWHPSLPMLHVLLPVGISFYTFQSLSYTIDVYRGQLQARRSLTDFALFVTMFPQLVAGPIERARTLLPRIERERTLDFPRIESAACLIVWGLFKKLVVADTIVIYADRIFELPQPSGALIVAGAAAFTLQIYADFSGYTDIARGSARLLGFELMENFRAPYLATSPSDFWRRWHISFSSWIRDYLYFPLGGSRGGPGRFVFAALTAMTLSGLWHGASWNFVVWGLYHGVLVVLYHLVFRRVGARLAAAWGEGPARALALGTMLPLTMLGWLVFRQQDFGRLANYFTSNPFRATPEELSTALGVLALTLGLAAPFVLRGRVLALAPESRPLRAACAWACILGIFLLARETGQDFIYFAF